jgi:hypothetical protein
MYVDPAQGVISVKRQSSGKYFIKNNTQRIEDAALVGTAAQAASLLRGYVGQDPVYILRSGMNLHLACLKINIDVLGAECGYQITLAVALGNIFTQRRVQREKPGEPVILGRFNILSKGLHVSIPSYGELPSREDT